MVSVLLFKQLSLFKTGTWFVLLGGNQIGSTLEPWTNFKKASTPVDGGSVRNVTCLSIAINFSTINLLYAG